MNDEDLGAGARVEVAGRLVGEDDLRPAGQRTGDGDTLLLATGQLRRSVLDAVAETDGVDDEVEPLLVGLAAGERQRQRDVLERGQRRHEVERLEDEADAVAAQLGELLVVELAEVGVADEHGAAGERVEAGDGVHQGRLARARRAHDRGELAGVEVGVDAVEGVDFRLAAAVGLAGVDRAGGEAGRPRRLDGNDSGAGKGDCGHLDSPCVRGW